MDFVLISSKPTLSKLEQGQQNSCLIYQDSPECLAVSKVGWYNINNCQCQDSNTASFPQTHSNQPVVPPPSYDQHKPGMHTGSLWCLLKHLLKAKLHIHVYGMWGARPTYMLTETWHQEGISTFLYKWVALQVGRIKLICVGFNRNVTSTYLLVIQRGSRYMMFNVDNGGKPGGA